MPETFLSFYNQNASDYSALHHYFLFILIAAGSSFFQLRMFDSQIIVSSDLSIQKWLQHIFIYHEVMTGTVEDLVFRCLSKPSNRIASSPAMSDTLVRIRTLKLDNIRPSK